MSGNGKSRWAAAALAATLLVVNLGQLSVAATPSEKAAARPDKLRFKDDVGKTLWSLKLKDDGAKLVDGNDQELARYTRSEKRIKIKDSADKVLGYVTLEADSFRLEAADQRTELYTLRRQAEGGWKLEDPQRARVVTLKPRDYGVELEDARSTGLYKVKHKSGKTSLRNSADKTVYRTDETISPAAMGCLGFDKIADLRLRVALLFALEFGAQK